MKKYFIIAAAALMAFTACNKSVAPVDAVDPDEIFDGSEKYPILFGTNVVTVKSPVVKGVGSVEAWDPSQKLYVYGVKRVDGSLDLTNGILINNAAAAAPSGAEGAIEVYEYPEQQIPYYYDYTATYDFFGYYVDDARLGRISRTASAVTLPITINGTQDVMLAKASREGFVNPTTTMPIDPEKLFSAYGARKGVQPNLKFEHQLTRLVFNVINGNGVAAEDEPTLFLESLSVASPASATLGIIGADPLTNVATATTDMALTNEGGAAFTQVGIAGTKKAGGCILVMPGQAEYALKFTLSQTGKPVSVEQTGVIKLSGESSFEAGKSYTVNLTIYNLEQIEISVSLTPWDTDTEIINIGGDEE